MNAVHFIRQSNDADEWCIQVSNWVIRCHGHRLSSPHPWYTETSYNVLHSRTVYRCISLQLLFKQQEYAQVVFSSGWNMNYGFRFLRCAECIGRLRWITRVVSVLFIFMLNTLDDHHLSTIGVTIALCIYRITCGDIDVIVWMVLHGTVV